MVESRASKIHQCETLTEIGGQAPIVVFDGAKMNWSGIPDESSRDVSQRWWSIKCEV